MHFNHCYLKGMIVLRIKRHELAVIALTLAFACFLMGYFAGRRDAVNIVTVTPQNTASQQIQESNQHNSANQNAPVQQPEAATPTAPESGSVDNPDNVAPQNNPTEQPEIVGAPKGGDGKININTATRSELMDLTGVGEVIAGRIIDYRTQHGPFMKIEDIMNVSGIGERRYEAIQDKITVG
jgi:competence protein ComEA